eukprot:SAG31_NODE_7657_length_1626_cov_1.582842_2_plen_51_part_00
MIAAADQFKEDAEVQGPLGDLQEHLKSLHGNIGKKLEDGPHHCLYKMFRI